MFCLQKGASFGKSQLLNGEKLVNQNIQEMAGKFKISSEKFETNFEM